MPSQIKERSGCSSRPLPVAGDSPQDGRLRRILPHRQRRKEQLPVAGQPPRGHPVLRSRRDAIMNCPARVKTGIRPRSARSGTSSLHPALHRSERPHEDRRPPEIPVLRSRVRRLQDVPEGLTIKAVENGATEVAATVAYRERDVHGEAADTPRASLQFSFAAADSWITARTTPRRRRFGRAPRSRRSRAAPQGPAVPRAAEVLPLPARWESKNWDRSRDVVGKF